MSVLVQNDWWKYPFRPTSLMIQMLVSWNLLRIAGLVKNFSTVYALTHCTRCAFKICVSWMRSSETLHKGIVKWTDSQSPIWTTWVVLLVPAVYSGAPWRGINMLSIKSPNRQIGWLAQVAPLQSEWMQLSPQSTAWYPAQRQIWTKKTS